MILGHPAIAVAANQTVFQRTNLAFLAVAALLPDILDKPASILLGLPGRGAGHTLIVFAAATCLAWLMSSSLRRNPHLLLCGMVMWSTHLAGDFVQWQLLLWPLSGALEHTASLAPWEWIHSVPLAGHLATIVWFDFWKRMYQFYVIRLWPEQFWLDLFWITMGLGLVAARSLLPRHIRPIPS